MTNEQIIAAGQQIYDETEVGANTSERIGGVIKGIGQRLATRDTEVDEALTQLANQNAGIDAKNGYYTNSQAANESALTVTAPGYVLSAGGNIRIRMAHANTASSVTLNINGTGAKALYYNGEPVDSENTWEDGETIVVYYDGESYYATNSLGGNNSSSRFGSITKERQFTDIDNCVYYKDGNIIKRLGNQQSPICGADVAIDDSIVSFTLLFESPYASDPYKNVWTIFADANNFPIGDRLYCDGVTPITVTEIPTNAKHLYVSSRNGMSISMTYKDGNQPVSEVCIVDEEEGGENNVLSGAAGKRISESVNTILQGGMIEKSIINRGYYTSGVVKNDGSMVPLNARGTQTIYCDKIAIPQGATKINIPYTQSANKYPHSVLLDANDNVVAAYASKGEAGSPATLMQTGWIDIPQGAVSIRLSIPYESLFDGTAVCAVRMYAPNAAVDSLFKKLDYTDVVRNTTFTTGYLKPDDTIVSSAVYKHSDYIEVPDGVVNVRLTLTYSSIVNATILYNTNKQPIYTFVPILELPGKKYVYEYAGLPSNVKYIRTSIYLNEFSIDDITLEFDMADAEIVSPAEVEQISEATEFLSEKIRYIEPAKNYLLFDAITEGDNHYLTNDDASVTATGWTLSDGVYTNTGTGFSNQLHINRYYWCTHRKIIVDFTAPANAKIYIGVECANYVQSSLISVDLSGKSFNLHNAPNDSISAVLESTPFISDSLSYRVEIRTRERGACDIRLIDMDKGKVVASITKPMQFAIPAWGLFVDMPYVFADTAGVNVTRFQVCAGYAEHPLLQIIGDSITQGYYADEGKDYASLIAQALGENHVIRSGRSGGIARQVKNILVSETSVLRPEYVMVTMGTNDAVEVDVFRLSIIAKIIELGAKPIINHIPCRTDSTSYIAQNTYIDTAIEQSGADVITVRMNNATAVNNNDNNPLGSADAILFNDNIHPNTYGHRSMFEQTLVDASDLFGL